ncbi:hypothetical protein SAMN05216559_2524 [Halomicrobium zhouii]|uniref:Uncharacterized protein n=2 Tax=Halomicrobium zhouii TaxID=767519 RepID=A0A1I6LDP4_9EURY|nr:hypothetical protein SAMN05216559_2524 [Halomicrobium zhouii]
MGRSVSRRQILSAVSLTGLGGLSGCRQLSGTRTELAGVQLVNPYYGTERIDVRIEQADEIVTEETLPVVQEEGAETLPCSWKGDGEEPVVEARLAGDGDWQRLDLAETDEEKAFLLGIVRPESGVSFVVYGEDDDFFVDTCAQEE